MYKVQGLVLCKVQCAEVNVLGTVQGFGVCNVQRSGIWIPPPKLQFSNLPKKKS